MRRLVGVFALLATVLMAKSGSASESLLERIPRIIEKEGWLRAHYPGEPGQPGQAPPSSQQQQREGQETKPLVGVLGGRLIFSLVARDWHEAFNLTDGRSLLFDRMRMIRSSRMAVVRVGLDGGLLLPYAEISAGQWRPDSDLVPWLRNDIEKAGQLALGFELRVAERCRIAWDVERTQIYGGVANLPTTKIYASFFAMHASF